MFVRSLSLVDFRSYPTLDLEFAEGLTAVIGENGQGKTNLLEAIGFVAGMGSFRGAPDDALVRLGAEVAVVRAVVESAAGREVLIEAEISRTGRNRIQVNRQRLRRTVDLVGELPITVFSPDDLDLVKSGPARRRRWLDDAVVARHAKHEQLRVDLERILRQRNTVLKQAGGRLSDEISLTLDVWDQKLAVVGDRLRAERLALLDDLVPHLRSGYDAVARIPAEVDARYVSSWGSESLATALVERRRDDLRRTVTTVGPHRDEVELTIAGVPARTHASQGEQRSLALSLRLAADAVARAAGATPVLLLDDVFSELDPKRATALLEALPDAQSILTSAIGLPPEASPDRVLVMSDGNIEVQASQ